jgi:DNA invertase Pin-like site-specific DNA recombinase
MSRGDAHPRQVVPDLQPGAEPATIDRPIRHRDRPAKILDIHLDRLAVVYVRQSSPGQVAHHKESARIQRGLRDLAIAWGWPSHRVVVIDEDQARSATSTRDRAGYQWLWAEVNLNHVGIIFGIAMDRLARSCKDWHDLMEQCTWYNTLLADRDAVYDSTVFNDRLLLGLRALMSEAELHLIRQRMNLGRMNKARRGALFTSVPMGYIRSGEGVALDPDDQVRSTLRLVFDKFEELGTVGAVLRSLARDRIPLGVRAPHGPDAGRLNWRPATRSALSRLLRHPIYSGCYVYGMTKNEGRGRDAARPAPRRVAVPTLQWEVLIPDRVPAYITWDQYLANQRRLKDNRSRPDAPGAPRGGQSLLAGLVSCARCGRRMVVAYRSTSRPVNYYVCCWEANQLARPRCQRLAGRALDALAAALVLEALEPAALGLSLAVAADLQAERQRGHDLWQQRLQRARYEAALAERQYQAVDPEHRLVARELERRWEQALWDRHQLEEDYDRFHKEQPLELGAGEREELIRLAADLPGVWQAETTSLRDRQEIVRFLIERVVVATRGRTEVVDVIIHWVGGLQTRHEIRRPVLSYEQLSDYDSMRGRVVELHGQGRTAGEIAAVLNGEGYRPLHGKERFNKQMIYDFLRRIGLSGLNRGSRLSVEVLGPDEWGVSALARQLGMPADTLGHWCARGWVGHRKLPGRRGCLVLWADEAELDRLRRLRAFRPNRYPPVYPAELTAPRGGSEARRSGSGASPGADSGGGAESDPRPEQELTP